MFKEKLNKKEKGTYSIQEKKKIENGKFEGILDHDNVIEDTIFILDENSNVIDNYMVSNPSEKPWETYITIYSSSDYVIVNYETQGDTVDADDINLLQEKVSSNKNDVNSLKDEIQKKSDKTFVENELLKKMDKDKSYTKQEVDERIENLIGNAPEALDTLVELADAIGNDPNFAGTITNMLAQKVDKEDGKSLSDENYSTAEKKKLANIEEKATYISDEQKSYWNNKAEQVDVDRLYTEQQEQLKQIANKADKDKVVTSVNGKTGEVKIDIKETNQFKAINKGKQSFDTFKDAGVYRLWHGETSPNGTIDDFILMVYEYDSKIVQVAHSMTSNSVRENAVYIRTYYNNWSDWYSIREEIKNKADKDHKHIDYERDIQNIIEQIESLDIPEGVDLTPIYDELSNYMKKNTGITCSELRGF